MTWHIVDHTVPAVFSTLSSTFGAQGEVVTHARTRDLLRVEASQETFYVKRYWSAGKGFRAVCLRSRARAEWENLQYFKQLNLPTPLLMAYGEMRHGMRYDKGAFVMRALNNVESLDLLLSDRNYPREKRLSILRQIAEGLRRLHDHHFIHGDCFVRNFLVSMHNATVYFVDCPRGRFMWGPFFNYHRVRDLFSFFKGAKDSLSLTDQMRFFLWYQKTPRLTDQGKQLLMKVIQRRA